MRRALELLEKEKQRAAGATKPRPMSKDDVLDTTDPLRASHHFKRNGSGMEHMSLDEGKSTAMSTSTSRIGSGDPTKARPAKPSNKQEGGAPYELSVKAATKKP